MKSKIFGLMGVMGLLFAGCSSEDDILSSFHNDPDAVHITAEVGKASADGFTRSNPLGATAEEQQKFNDGDEISVKADGQEAVIYKLNGSEWQPQGGKFLKWESETMNFTAYYPASYTGGAITQPTAYPDEASLIAADYMSFTDDVKNPGDNSLTLTMKRKMARVVIEIVKFNDQYAEGTKVNSVTINGDVKAYKQSDNTYYALMVPCEAETTKEFLSLEVGTNNVKETLTGIPAFAAGNSYTYKLKVGKNKISVSGITVKDWTTGEITGGKAEYYDPIVTFRAEKAQTFKMEVNSGYQISNLEYSVNGGNWTPVVAYKEVDFGGDNGTLRLRGKNHSGTSSENCIARSFITFTKENVPVACTGDIRTLLDWEKYKTVNTENARFYGLFKDCKALTSAPELPATKLASKCYSYMFKGCTNLKTAPALPAETLVYYCYHSMFQGCTNLTSVTMLASGEQIDQSTGCFDNWLYNAGTAEGITRTLKVKDADAYSMLERRSSLHNWEKGTEGTTVLDENGNEIE